MSELKEIAVLEDEQKNLKSKDGIPLVPMIEMLQQYIDAPPMQKNQLYAQACSNDTITIESWEKTWIENARRNSKFDFNANSAIEEYGKEATKPVIIAGSGPSLKKNAHYLKNRGNIKVVSCLHNFGYFEDLGVMGKDDYYVSLDAGSITIPEMIEGGSKYKPEEYWALTKDRTLIAFICTPIELLEKWQGRILFFLTPIPNEPIMKAFKEHVDFKKVPVFNVGGNALGACLYFAKAILGGGTIMFVGADFSFDYCHKFHSWKSGYDQQFAGVIPATNIFGNRVYTWQSYFNFKTWFEYIACGGKGDNPQMFINCSEGGILGAWPNGNIRQIIQMPLHSALHMFNMYGMQRKLMDDSDKQMVLLF